MNRTFSLAFLLLAAQITAAQDVLTVPFKVAPLTINPALTGMFNGNLRISAAYQNQWQSVTVPYVTVAVGADMPVAVAKNGNYLACGLQTIKSVAGDGNMANTGITASLAWHMQLGRHEKAYAKELAVGLQGGYALNSINIAYISSGNWTMAQQQQMTLGGGNDVAYYNVNAGVNYSQSIGSKFNYTLGVAGYNLNQPHNDIDRKQNRIVGLSPAYVEAAGANWAISARVTLQPAFLCRQTEYNNTFTIGTDVQYILLKSRSPSLFPYIFAGAWYRDGDVVTATAGVGIRSFRAGVVYDYYYGNLNTKTGGFQIQCSYIAPRRKATPSLRTVPCDRF